MADREMSTFERIVRDRLDDLGTNPFAAEARSPLKEGVIRNVLRGTDVRLTTAKGICDALGLELYIGPPRRDPTDPVVDPIAADLAMIRRFDIAASAGHGAIVEAERELEPLAFRRDWLHRRGLFPAKAYIVEARGNSMEPVIADGDLVMIDTTKTEIPVARDEHRARASFWVVRREGELLVKDASRTDERTIVLTSVDPLYLPIIVDLRQAEAFEVIGRVAWWGHTVPF